MDGQKKGKKRPKSYYIKCAAGGKKLNKSTCIEPGMKGFLITCNKYERETVREMYNILNEYADKLYGPEKLEASGQQSLDSDDSSEEEDMEKAMAKETAAIKQGSSQQRRFQNTNTKTKNIIFIRTTIDDPCHLVHSMFEDMHENQVQKARYAQRIIPVSIICKVDSKTIETAMKTVLAPLFETDFGVGVKYTAICKIRNNNAMSRVILLPLLNRIIQEMNPLHQLCHDEPDLVVVIETMRNVCCLSVVKDFFKFRKYNFHEIMKKVQDDKEEFTVKVDGEEESETSGISEVKNGDKIEPVSDNTNGVVNVITNHESKEINIENDNVYCEVAENTIRMEEEKENAVDSSLEKIDQNNEKHSVDNVEANKCNEDNGVKSTEKLEGSENIDLISKENVETDNELSDDVVENT